MFKSETDKGEVNLLDSRYGLNKYNKYLDEDLQFYRSDGLNDFSQKKMIIN